MSWDSEVDVVVLGTGGAGLTAALSAVAGRRPLSRCFEKGPDRRRDHRGVGRRRGGFPPIIVLPTAN